MEVVGWQGWALPSKGGYCPNFSTRDQAQSQFPHSSPGLEWGLKTGIVGLWVLVLPFPLIPFVTLNGAGTLLFEPHLPNVQKGCKLVMGNKGENVLGSSASFSISFLDLNFLTSKMKGLGLYGIPKPFLILRVRLRLDGFEYGWPVCSRLALLHTVNSGRLSPGQISLPMTQQNSFRPKQNFQPAWGEMILNWGLLQSHRLSLEMTFPSALSCRNRPAADTGQT